ncbi:MAG TPA: 3-deoxy-7-phosphoheptulonate synthase [Syntrophomonadaceae bacterium]|jgi:3-deoxy-7-phosphoheptulonate synthase|nr:3-deoxy-7-phosphoheptulonate synthase [Syntrophomonadaceae bacterium]
MVVVMQAGASEEQLLQVEDRLHHDGFKVHLSRGANRIIIGAIGNTEQVDRRALEALPGVEKIISITRPFKLASREFQPENTIIQIGDHCLGDGSLIMIAGPCAVEGREKYLQAAWAVKKAGADLLRGGAFKPRTSPYSFQGLGEEGLKIMAEARELTGLPIVTELMDQKSLDMVVEYADIVQIGARNMQNFLLLKDLGSINKPVLLKRGMSATIEEWLMAAEYILMSGNPQVILCERGIRTFETYTRNTLDLSAVPLVKELSHLPVLVDPSHGTGKRELVAPMAMAAAACGADGLIIEMHPHPEEAWSDGPQSLVPEQLSHLIKHCQGLRRSLQAGEVI